jgi:hypothetical protein
MRSGDPINLATFGGRGGAANCRIRAGVLAGRAPTAEGRLLFAAGGASRYIGLRTQEQWGTYLPTQLEHGKERG